MVFIRSKILSFFLTQGKIRSFLFVYLFSYLLLVIFFLGSIYFTLPDVSYLKKTNPRSTALIEFRKKQGKLTRIRHRWIPLNRIPVKFRQCVIVAEDASFWVHNGIDWYEVWESLKRNFSTGKFKRGGSTITQQLAKNLFLTPEKKVSRKIREWFIARELEKQLKKSRILELYLNSIEWGRGIFGIRAAANYYFRKLPDQLTLDEMVRLAAVLPNPLRWQPDRPSRTVRWRAKEILRRMRRFHFIDEQEYQETLIRLNTP